MVILSYAILVIKNRYISSQKEQNITDKDLFPPLTLRKLAVHSCEDCTAFFASSFFILRKIRKYSCYICRTNCRKQVSNRQNIGS